MTRFAAMAAVVLASIFISSCTQPAPVSSRPAYTPTTYVLKPRITIRNNTYKTLVVGVRGPESRMVSVPARSSRLVTLRSGVYKYAAAAKNTRTISGYKTFTANRSYTWNFGTR